MVRSKMIASGVAGASTQEVLSAPLRASRLRLRMPQGTWQEVANDFKMQVKEQSEIVRSSLPDSADD
jgi:hypothetical protein